MAIRCGLGKVPGSALKIYGGERRLPLGIRAEVVGDLSGDLCALLLWIDRVLFGVKDKVVDAVFDVRGGTGSAEQPMRIGFIFRDEKFRITFDVKQALSKVPVRCRDDCAGFVLTHLTNRGAGPPFFQGTFCARASSGRICSVVFMVGFFLSAIG
jgi:hypothetical protein